MRVTHDELCEMVGKFEEEHIDSSHIYVVMRWGYTEREMLNSSYEVQLLMYDEPFKIVWESDWWEGETYIDLFGIYSDDDFVNIVTAKRSD